MRDRHLAFSLAAGFAALLSGVVAGAADIDSLGLVAGIFGFAAAISGVGMAARLRRSTERIVALTEERDLLRRDLDAVNTLFTGETQGPETEILPLARRSPTEAIVDSASGLLEEHHFKVLVTKRVAAARRQLQPISIVMFQIDGLEGADSATSTKAVNTLGEVITTTLRESDAACRIGTTMASAILEDTAEAGAVWAAERIRGALHHYDFDGSLTVSAGIACYPTHALSAPELMERAGRALDSARAQGRDRLEVATAD